MTQNPSNYNPLHYWKSQTEMNSDRVLLRFITTELKAKDSSENWEEDVKVCEWWTEKSFCLFILG